MKQENHTQIHTQIHQFSEAGAYAMRNMAENEDMYL